MTPENEGSAETEPLTPGALLRERYQVLVRIGGGGMGVVYSARDLTLGRDVALKVVRSAGDAALKSRFRREVQLASRVHHPHTVYVSDVGELPDGRGFLAMELLQGGTLRAVLTEHGRLDPLRACRIGAMIASGMQSVHEAGIIHRDLKPANIFLLDKEGTRDFVKIVDFGVAKELDLSSSSESTSAPLSESGGEPGAADATAQSEIDSSLAALTRNGSIIGTPRYMAPEQLRGEALDARADQYALGCILYELLTGAPPFEGGAQQVARGHLYGEPVSPRAAQPQAQISKELEDIVLRAMSRQREARFPHMRALAGALQEEAERLQRKSTSRLQPGVRWRTVSLGALAAAALGVGAIQLVRGRSGPRPAERAPDVQELRPAVRESARGGAGTEGPPARAEPAARAPEVSAPPVSIGSRAQSLSAAPLRKKAGPARIAAATEPESPAPEPVPDLVAGATSALRRGDSASALRLLSSARQRCARAAGTTGCAEYSAQIAVSLGRLNEAEGHWAEALAEYSRALGDTPGAAPADEAGWRQEAEAATGRLAARLGRVLIKRSRGGRCEEVSMFLPPGEHQLEIEGQRQLITIKAREMLRLGRCSEP